MLCAFAVLLKYSIPSVACYRDAFTDNTSCIIVVEPVIEAFGSVGLLEAVWSFGCTDQMLTELLSMCHPRRVTLSFSSFICKMWMVTPIFIEVLRELNEIII